MILSGIRKGLVVYERLDNCTLSSNTNSIISQTVKLLKSKVTLLNTCENPKMTHETQRDLGNKSNVNDTKLYCITKVQQQTCKYSEISITLAIYSSI
jgi:hypothetical protein